MREPGFVFILSLLLTLLLAYGVRRHRFGLRLLGFFLLLFLATWAGGLWITSGGLPMYDIWWLSFLAVGLIVAFLLSVLIQPSGGEQSRKGRPAGHFQGKGGAVLFWIITLVLTAAIVLYYFAGPALD